MIRHLFRPLTAKVEYNLRDSYSFDKYRRRIKKIDTLVSGITEPIARFLYRGVLQPKPEDSPIIGMHTTFVARDVILILDEWISYYRSLGVEHFFLYDNSTSETITESIANNGGGPIGQIGKRNVQHYRFLRMTEQDIQDELNRIQHSYSNIHIIHWAPLNKDNKVWYGQRLSQNRALRQARGKVDWMFFMDIDEFLVPHKDLLEICQDILREGYSGALFDEMPMEHHSSHIDKSVCSITRHCPNHARINQKMLCHVGRTLSIPDPHDFDSISGKKRYKGLNGMHYRHYRCHSMMPEVLVEVEPLTHKSERDSEWKPNQVSEDWREIMDETRMEVDRCRPLYSD